MEIDMLNKMLDVKKSIDGNGTDNVLEMIELLKEKNKNVKSKTKEMERKLPDTNFMDDVSPPAIRSIKSCIPYLEEKYQRNVALIVKFIELQTLMDKYKFVSTETKNKGNENWKKGMLLAVKAHMPDNQKQKADTLIQMMELQDVFNLMQNINGKKDGSESGASE